HEAAGVKASDGNVPRQGRAGDGACAGTEAHLVGQVAQGLDSGRKIAGLVVQRGQAEFTGSIESGPRKGLLVELEDDPVKRRLARTMSQAKARRATDLCLEFVDLNQQSVGEIGVRRQTTGERGQRGGTN